MISSDCVLQDLLSYTRIMEASHDDSEASKPVSPFQNLLGAFQGSEDSEVQSPLSDDVSTASTSLFLGSRVFCCNKSDAAVKNRFTINFPAKSSTRATSSLKELHRHQTFSLLHVPPSRACQVQENHWTWTACAVLSRQRAQPFLQTSK